MTDGHECSKKSFPETYEDTHSPLPWPKCLPMKSFPWVKQEQQHHMARNLVKTQLCSYTLWNMTVHMSNDHPLQTASSPPFPSVSADEQWGHGLEKLLGSLQFQNPEGLGSDPGEVQRSWLQGSKMKEWTGHWAPGPWPCRDKQRQNGNDSICVGRIIQKGQV